jgi:AraC-like DNA-binding protein
MRYWRIDPHPRLRPGIVCYFVALPPAEASRDKSWREELLLPDGYSELVFSLSAQFERWPVGESDKRSTMRSSYIIGGRSHSVLTRNLGDLTIIGVKLDSRVLRRLIATPLSEFRDATLSLEELHQQPLLDLEDALANALSIERLAELMNDFFLARMNIFQGSDALVSELLRRIHEVHGGLSIMQWIHEQDIDSRHFERRFCACMGMTPKRYARIVRFKHSYYRLLCGEGGRGAVGLHLDEYYDQSHFHRDFKYFLGATPSARLSHAVPHGTDISEHLIHGEFSSRVP